MIYYNRVLSLSVWIAGSNELKSIRFHKWLSTDSMITHNLLDQSNILSGVGFIEEQHGLHAWEFNSILLSMFHCLIHLALNVTGCCSTMNLHMLQLNCDLCKR